MNEEIGKMTECPKCGLEFKTLLHSLCIHNECPARNYTRRPIAELAEEGMRQGRAISSSPRIWEYEGADGVWHECRNADDACMWAEDGRRIREANPLGVVELDGFNMIEAKDEDHSQSRTVGERDR